MDIEGQVALVIGGASGIGLATTVLLLRAGLLVAVGDSSQCSGEATVKKLQQEYGTHRVIYHYVNVTDEETFEAAFSTTREHFKRLDIFINSVILLLDSQWSYEIDVNVKGVIQGTLLAWKHMGKNEGRSGGVVVNVASVFGLLPGGGIPVYTSTKYAVVGWGRSAGTPFNHERTGVRVLTICPGITDSPLVNKKKSLQESCLTPEHQAEVIRQIGTWKSQPADHVASSILHIIQQGISGSVWVVNNSEPVYEVVFPDLKSMKIK